MEISPDKRALGAQGAASPSSATAQQAQALTSCERGLKWAVAKVPLSGCLSLACRWPVAGPAVPSGDDVAPLSPPPWGPTIQPKIIDVAVSQLGPVSYVKVGTGQSGAHQSHAFPTTTAVELGSPAAYTLPVLGRPPSLRSLSPVDTYLYLTRGDAHSLPRLRRLAARDMGLS